MRRLAFGAALLAALACTKLTDDPDQVVALEVVLPDSGRVEVGDTLFPRARGLNADGDSVMAEVFWAALDTTLEVLDSATGTTLGVDVGTGRLQARIGGLRSNPQTVVVVPFVDSAEAAGPRRDTIFVAGDSLSDSLQVRLLAIGGTPQNRRVVFEASTYPSGAATVTFLPNDTVATGGTGIAVAQLRLVAGTVPDSAVVTATARGLRGGAVPGSPVTFVVEFRP